MFIHFFSNGDIFYVFREEAIPKRVYSSKKWFAPTLRVLGGAMMLRNFPTNLIRVGQGPTALAVGAGRGCLDISSLFYHFSFLLPLSGRRPDID